MMWNQHQQQQPQQFQQGYYQAPQQQQQQHHNHHHNNNQPQHQHQQAVYQAPQSNPYPQQQQQHHHHPQPQQQQHHQQPNMAAQQQQPYQQANPYRPGAFHHGGGGYASRGGYNNSGNGRGNGGGFGGNDRFTPPAPVTPYTREEKDVEEIFKDQSAGIDFSKYEEINVSINPSIPSVDTFEDMNVPAALTENIKRCKYTKPTPVQRYGIPSVLGGGDLMACAQTGSGKTAAYLIPAVAHMLHHRTTGLAGRTATPTALILAPTRELGIQIYEESRKFTYHTSLRCVVLYGGADPRYQLNELSRGCSLVVATPGRLLDMFSRGTVRFSDIHFLVLDEADRMLDMGFEPQIRQIVQGPESDMPGKEHRQTLMYSATFPRDIQQLAREFLKREHYFLQVGRVGSTTESITQDVRLVEDNDKRTELLNIITQHENEYMLIFVEKKRDADYIERFLCQRNYAAVSIHGDRAQREREMALSSFKCGRVNILVATDVAARGLDIPDVTLVVQYDLPSNIDSYVHRIGRTGRAGKKGLAIAFFNEKNKNVVDELVELMDEAKQNTPDWLKAMVTKRPQQNFGRGRGGNNFFRGAGRGGNFGGGFGARGGFNNNRGGFNNNRGGYGGYNNNNGGRGGGFVNGNDRQGGMGHGAGNNAGFNFRQPNAY